MGHGRRRPAAIEGVLAHPELELVGCLVYSDVGDAKPGMASYLDLPLVAGRAAIR